MHCVAMHSPPAHLHSSMSGTRGNSSAMHLRAPLSDDMMLLLSLSAVLNR